MTDQNAAVKQRLVDRGGESEADARRPRTAGGAASRWVVQRQATVAGKYVAFYFKGSQDRCNMFVGGRLGPDLVPGNLFPAREIYFPGINIPSFYYCSCKSKCGISCIFTLA